MKLWRLIHCADILAGPRLFFHIAWGNFESDFQDALTSLMLHRDVVTDEATLSHRKKVHDILELTKGSLINENDLVSRNFLVVRNVS